MFPLAEQVSVDEEDLSVSVNLRADLIDIEFDASGPYPISLFDPNGYLTLQMTTTRFHLLEVATDLEAAGFGFSYDGTSYSSPSMEQEFYGSEFLTTHVDEDSYAWQGPYLSTVTKGPMTLYQSGYASSLGGNFTDYFCDEALQDKLGSAQHDDSLEFGIFTLADGSASFEYGL